MTARLRKFLSDLGETFWLIPAVMVLCGVLGAIGLVELDRSGFVPRRLLDSSWLYNGGGTGARTLLGAVVSSTIGVAGTVFSITIAALSLAAGQMGPRLLRNFTRDRGNQFTLGVFLGTFSYALMVLRSVRTQTEGEFVPHLSLSVSILLAFICVATLVYFVAHVAGRINVDTVVELVSEDLRLAVDRLTTKAKPCDPPPVAFWRRAAAVSDGRHGYLQHLDGDGLAHWAAEHGTVIRLMVRPGDFVFPGAPIAMATPLVGGIERAIFNATALGPQRVSSDDLEFAVRQLVEVAVRALSPGINDPYTAINVLDRLGAALCEIVPLHLPSGVWLHDDRPVLVIPPFDYEGLTDAMFHMLRQNAKDTPAVLIRMIEVFTAVASCEKNPERVESLSRHANLVLADAERHLSNPMDVQDVRQRHADFAAMRHNGPVGYLGALESPLA